MHDPSKWAEIDPPIVIYIFLFNKTSNIKVKK